MTDQWQFVIAAYAVAGFGTAALILVSWRAMCKAETRAADVQRNDAV